jgi:hypothetical protein
MAIMNDIKGDGHSLVAPRASVGWVVYAVFAILILFGIVFFVVKLGRKAVSNVPVIGAGLSGAEAQSNIQMQGFY